MSKLGEIISPLVLHTQQAFSRTGGYEAPTNKYLLALAMDSILAGETQVSVSKSRPVQGLTGYTD